MRDAVKKEKKVVIYVEVQKGVKAGIEALSRHHRRKLNAEVEVALIRYIRAEKPRMLIEQEEEAAGSRA